MKVLSFQLSRLSNFKGLTKTIYLQKKHLYIFSKPKKKIIISCRAKKETLTSTWSIVSHQYFPKFLLRCHEAPLCTDQSVQAVDSCILFEEITAGPTRLTDGMAGQHPIFVDPFLGQTKTEKGQRPNTCFRDTPLCSRIRARFFILYFLIRAPLILENL